MANLQDIQRRIKSVKNTQQITKAMKMVSAAKLRRAQEDIVAARPYAEKMLELVKGLTERTSADANPLLSEGSGTTKRVLLVTSDRGLCGGFNTNNIKLAERFIRENRDVALGLVGKRGGEYFKRRDTPISSRIDFGSGKPDYHNAVNIARDAIKDFLSGEVGEIYVVYTKFVTAMTQEPVIQKLLPVGNLGEEGEGAEAKEASGEVEGVFSYEPDEEGVLDALLPKYIEVQIYRALLESAASEHGARMTAMDSASTNAKEMIGSLTLTYNRIRQAAITTELMDIVGGAEAISK